MAGAAVGYVTENVGPNTPPDDAAVGYVTENVGVAATGRWAMGAAAGGPTSAQIAGYVTEYVTTAPLYPGAGTFPGADVFPQG